LLRDGESVGDTGDPPFFAAKAAAAASRIDAWL
jgi:hypothetical protein